jgi:hypothetical protein
MHRCVGEEEIKMLKMRGRFSFVIHREVCVRTRRAWFSGADSGLSRIVQNPSVLGFCTVLGQECVEALECTKKEAAH